MRFANLNGKFLPYNALLVSATNSALRCGWGIFETLLMENEVIALANYHWERLWKGIEKMQFETPAGFTSEFLEEEIRKTITKNQVEKLCRVRLQLFTELQNGFDPERKASQYLIECFPLEHGITEWNENGWKCGIAEGIVKQQDDFSALKTCNMQPYFFAAQQAKEKKWNDAFIKNQQGNIIESSIANIFWVKEEQVYTVLLSEGCIAGVMRRYVLENCRAQGIPVYEKSLTKAALLDADEIFLTNAIRKIKWVSEVEMHTYSDSFTKALYETIF